MAGVIRPGGDGDDFAGLITACWSEHPDIVIDLDAEAPELRALATHFARAGGALWAADGDAGLAGMIGVRPDDAGAWEVCRLYVARAERGAGLAHALLDAAEAYAIEDGARRLTLWTDTRFTRAHRFYERRGYARLPGARALHDLSASVEFGYARAVRSRD